MSSSKNLRVPTFEQVQVHTDRLSSSSDFLESQFTYESVEVERDARECVFKATPTKKEYSFRTNKTVPKVGVMFVGWGGNNGSTVTAGVLANREGITWRTRKGVEKPDYLGSLTQASTVRLGTDRTTGEDVFVPMNALLPMLNPNDLVLGGWDISSLNLAQAMQRAAVLDFDLQRQLAPLMQDLKPLPSVYCPDFIAANQKDRADNLMKATSKKEQIAQIREDIRRFKAQNGLDKVIVLWTANTERFAEVRNGLNDTWENLWAAIEANEDEISPSTLFCIATLQEGCSYINGSPQNTFVPGLVEFSLRFPGQFIGGDDFKSGQTKMKSVLCDFLISAGIKPTSIVSYNHLGNNDGKNLNAPAQFRSKEISKSNVVDDMVASNNIMYEEGEHPDHCVVIKYVPAVGDSKRAMDEYTSKIFMGGTNTIVLHNTCEDSLLAAPLMLDLVVLTELFERIQWKPHGANDYESFHPVLSPLSYLLKAPMVPPNTPVVNALARQRAAIENILKACAGLPADNSMMLEHRGRTPFLAQ